MEHRAESQLVPPVEDPHAYRHGRFHAREGSDSTAGKLPCDRLDGVARFAIDVIRLREITGHEEIREPAGTVRGDVLELPWEREMMQRAHAAYDLSETALPEDPRAFAEWFKTTAFGHPLYEHDLYAFLASEASRAQLEWFFTMECAGEAAFDDLVALAQVGTRGDVKMEMASNYWDEMGRGRAHAVHTHLFQRLIDGLNLVAPPATDLPWQVLAGVNVMLWSCIPRRNAFRAQGTLGAVELLAPQRCTRVVHGAERVGIRKKSVVYYGAHAIIDIGHAEGWLEHVIEPQVAAHPPARIGIAEGLIARADASLDYFDYCLAAGRTLASPGPLSQPAARKKSER